MLEQQDQTVRNIQAIVDLEHKTNAKISYVERIAMKIAQFSGSVIFILVHAVFFSVWIGINLTAFHFDPYPFTFLTMTVSLEAIFLSSFVMISQNALGQQTERRHKLDLQINLLAEQENTTLLRVVNKIAMHIGLPEADLVEIQKYLRDTDPGELLEEISICEET